MEVAFCKLEVNALILLKRNGSTGGKQGQKVFRKNDKFKTIRRKGREGIIFSGLTMGHRIKLNYLACRKT